MAMPEKMPEHIWAFVGASFQGLWIQCAKPETTPYIRSDLVSDAVKALEAAKIVIGMGDKPRKLDDALTWRQCDEKAKAMIDAAISRIKGD